MKKIFLSAVFLAIGFLAGLRIVREYSTDQIQKRENSITQSFVIPTTTGRTSSMAIEELRAREYPVSPLTITQTLTPGSDYNRYIASYLSDGLTIYGLLTVPTSAQPEKGFPAVLFLHGYIQPESYVTTADYVATQGGLAESGFVTYKPDMRGHGKSDGVADGAHFSESYTVDSLNALSSLSSYDGVNPDAIGLWGHSNGGEIGLRMLVITEKIKAAVLWAGVVGSFTDMLEVHIDRISFLKRQVDDVFETYGSPSANPTYWNQIEPYRFLSNIRAPVQLHHGMNDFEVPIDLSRNLYTALEDAGKTVELYEYPGADHNMTGVAFSQAMSRTIDFFRKYLK